MDQDSVSTAQDKWIKVGNLLVDASSLEKGFGESQRHRQEIWNYIQYRESLVKWPYANERIGRGLNVNGEPP